MPVFGVDSENVLDRAAPQVEVDEIGLEPGSRLIAAATFAETNDLPTLGVAETTPSMRQPRSRCSATSLERIRLKLRELALRLSNPCTSRRRASARAPAELDRLRARRKDAARSSPA